jgi:hypothetical protein
MRSCPKPGPSRGRVLPRANWTTKRSPMNSEPSNQRCMSVLENIWRAKTVRLFQARRMPSGSCASTWISSYGKLKRVSISGALRRAAGQHTRHDITCVHGIFVLDKAESVHKLDLGDLASAMGVEVVLNVGLGSYSARGPVSEFRRGERVQAIEPGLQLRSDGPMPGGLCARECRVARDGSKSDRNEAPMCRDGW